MNIKSNIQSLSLILFLIIITFGVMSCGGGGSGSLNPIPGENPGTPSVVQLAPSSFIAQTNGFITFSAKVLDGNGKPISNQNVTFTNLSSIGVLQATTAITDSTGIARVNLSSTTPGFATVLAQVYTGAGQVRDRKTVFFTTKDTLNVTMDMDVNSVPGNTVYNELSDFTLFEDGKEFDDTVEVLVTVRDAGGVPVGGGWSVFWSRSHTEATWVRTETSTNIFGQAKAVVKVEPASLRNTDTHVNIMAFADNGAANMVTLFLRPVVPDPALSSVTATPTIVVVGGTSTITAVVITNLGTPAPNGTIVNFTATCGRLSSFAPITSGGIATTTFTAPNSPGATCTITGKVAGITIGSAAITVRAFLTPSTATICENTAPCGTGNSVLFAAQAFTINGVAPYIVTSSHPTVISSPGTLAGNTFTVNAIDSSIASDTTVTLSVEDSGGNTATATVTVINQ